MRVPLTRIARSRAHNRAVFSPAGRTRILIAGLVKLKSSARGPVSESRQSRFMIRTISSQSVVQGTPQSFVYPNSSSIDLPPNRSSRISICSDLMSAGWCRPHA